MFLNVEFKEAEKKALEAEIANPKHTGTYKNEINQHDQNTNNGTLRKSYNNETLQLKASTSDVLDEEIYTKNTINKSRNLTDYRGRNTPSINEQPSDLIDVVTQPQAASSNILRDELHYDEKWVDEPVRKRFKLNTILGLGI